MTKAAALYSFWSSFGIPAYEENSVPAGEFAPEFPYITYELITDGYMNSIGLTASIWYKSTSLVGINEKAEEISKRLGAGGVTMKCDGGMVWLQKGSPFAQTMGDESDNQIRRKIINIIANFFTSD